LPVFVVTCVVGIEQDGLVWLGGDSSCLDTEGDAVVTQRQSKVFRRGNYVVGFAGSFQVGDLLKYKTDFPKKASQDSHPRMISEAIQEAFKKAKLKTDDWEALIGYGDRLYIVQHDFYCYRHTQPYTAIGAASAVAVALGTLRTLEKAATKKMTGRARVKMALENAATFSSSVRSPWKFTKTLEPK
jgi:ATP-dependent protease HslVU (ClpYQ) peptidase subunit